MKTLQDIHSFLPEIEAFTKKEQAEIEQEFRAFQLAPSELEKGSHLLNLREMLERRELWKKFALNYPQMTLRTLYRYMHSFENAAKLLPKNVLAEAIARGYRMGAEDVEMPLGIYTQVVKLIPPPRNASPSVARKYLDEVEGLRLKMKREVRTGEVHPSRYRPAKDLDTVVAETFRMMRDRKRYLEPEEHRKYLKLVVGLALTLFDVKREMTFQPVPLPEELRGKAESAA